MIAYAVLALILIIIGAGLDHWWMRGRIDRINAAHSAKLLATQTEKADTEARYRQRELQAAQSAALAQSHYHEALSHAQTENDALRVAVAAGTSRLYVRATCPTFDGSVPADAGTGAGTHAAAAELEPDARPDYLALRLANERVEQQIIALQKNARDCHLLTTQAH